jgi:Xaa-Pro aminopeptidase
MSRAPSDALRRRHDAVRASLAASDLGALVVTSMPNLLYLTNFTGSTAIGVITRERVYFVTDFRYRTAIEATRGTSAECPDLELVMVEGSYDATLARLLARLAVPRVAVEASHLTVSRYEWLRSSLSQMNPDVHLVPTDGVVEAGRLRKDSFEIATLKEAARRLSAVARDLVTEVMPRRSEHELAMVVDWRLRDAGFSKPAFDTIVASGPNAALPHARPGERTLTEGDLVVLDFGGVYDSYCVDLTRTVSLGRASERARTVYQAVREAHDRAIAAVVPGRSRFDIDRAARDTLDRHGLGEAFGHGTGHGLGIEVHELPRIVQRRPDVDESDEAVQPGMVFTIEPGAYLPGWGGVRIEDDVLVTADGVEVLTDVTTELIEI